MLRLLARGLAAAALVVPAVASAFDARGHEMSGAIADELLTPAARARLQATLGLPLRAAATWPDCVRSVERDPDGSFRYRPEPAFRAACAVFETGAGTARMVDYARRNWDNCGDPAAAVTGGCHARYHFADVEIGHRAYSRAFAGTSDHDIVSALGAAITVLQDRTPPPPVRLRDKAEALLLLSHLVGDLHQPLHVGAVYLDADGRRVDPGASGTPRDPALETRGGNRLEDGGRNLHSDWDDVPNSLDPLRVSKAMLKRAEAVPSTAGAPAAWPTAWAGETLRVARRAYAGMSFTRAGAVRRGDWVIRFDDRAAYMRKTARTQRRQVMLAGARLAQLLNSIWP